MLQKRCWVIDSSTTQQLASSQVVVAVDLSIDTSWVFPCFLIVVNFGGIWRDFRYKFYISIICTIPISVQHLVSFLVGSKVPGCQSALPPGSTALQRQQRTQLQWGRPHGREAMPLEWRCGWGWRRTFCCPLRGFWPLPNSTWSGPSRSFQVTPRLQNPSCRGLQS